MLVNVVTIQLPFDPKRESHPSREIDFSKVGNQKWLVSHLKWAIANKHFVQINPIQS